MSGRKAIEMETVIMTKEEIMTETEGCLILMSGRKAIETETVIMTKVDEG